MKKLFALICIILLPGWSVSCDLLDKGHKRDRPRNDISRTDSLSGKDSGGSWKPSDTVLFTSGVRFPDGYDWRIDTLAEKQKGELVLFKGTELVLAIPVGPENNVSADPDMHRIVDGHLYTDYSSNTKTIVQKDGKVLFSYDGREQMCGFAVVDSNVWTLGQDRFGEGGLSLRKNGKVVYEHKSGTIVGSLADTFNPYGALDFVDGKPVFFYYYKTDGSLSQSIHCIMVQGDKETDLGLPDRFSRILDAKLVDGKAVVVGKVGTSRNILSVFNDGRLIGFTLQGYDNLGTCKIIPAGDGVLYYAGECYSNGASAGFISDNDGYNRFYDLAGRLIGFYVGKGINIILSCGTDGADPVITTNGISNSVPGYFNYISTKCGELVDEKFYLGMNSQEDGPYILNGKKKQSLGFNGFITEVKAVIIKNEKK